MKLTAVKKDAQEIATAISEVMGVDVVIVDTELQRIADTFHYPYRSITIHKSSIIGRILDTGHPLLVDNKDYFQSCAECKERLWCQMQGLMGVPIFYRREVVGAIGLVVEGHNVRHLVENSNLVFAFLQQMADLLSVKLGKAEDDDSMQTLTSRWEYVLNTVDAGVVMLDGNNTIIVHNEHFCRIFGIESECYSHQLTEFVSHPAIERILQNQSDVMYQTVIIPLKDSFFYGQLQVKRMWQNDLFQGSILSFRDLYHTIRKNPDIAGTVCPTTSLEEIFQERQVLDKLGHCAKQEVTPLLLCGNEGKSRYLTRVAGAIHHHSGRVGKFTCFSSDDWNDLLPLSYDLSDVANVPLSLLISHQGTLCIKQVFDLPVRQQQCLLDYLRKITSGEKLNFSVRMIFLITGELPDPNSRFICRELLEELLPHMVKIPNPVQSKKALHHQLEQYLKDYSDCYHREGLELESQAWDLLLEFPWEESDYPLHKIVECLVQDSSTIISAEQTRGLLSELNASPKSVEGFEQEQIQRLLNEGASVEQITNILKISRSTLYRRIKKYNFKSKE